MNSKPSSVNSRGAQWVTGMFAVIMAVMTGWQPADGANVMNYGADGNDYFQFKTPSIAFDKASGFTTLIAFAMHVDTNGTLEIGGGPVCTNGVYIGPTNWGSLITTLKTPPTTVTRYEVSIGGWQDTSWADIENLIAAQGNGPASILYKNFQALKNAVPGIDAINDDDEETYDLNSSTSFANMIGGLGYRFTTVPYTDQRFWVNLNNAVTNCDYIYLQCYEGGAGNDPGQWNSAFGHGVKVVPGQESNTANPATFQSWYQETGLQGGFFYPDVTFNTTYWSAIVYQANGAVAAAPTNLVAVPGAGLISLSWNTDPGALSYNIKRSTVSGGETNVANISVDNTWPNSNQYLDTGLAGNVTYFYEISALNTNGEGPVSAEVSAIPGVATNYIAGVLALNPVGFWQLNETNGTLAHDTSGNNKNGIYHPGVRLGVAGVPNPPFVVAGGSAAAGFGGLTNTSSCVTLTNCPINSATVTIAEWIYPTVAGTLGTTFWNGGQNAGLSESYNNNAALGYNWHGGDGNQYEFVGEVPPVDQWSFVAMVITPTNAVFYMGNPSTGLASVSNPDGNAAVNFTTGTSIGGPNNGTETGLNGSLSGVAVFNYSLTAAQVTQLFADGYSLLPPSSAPAGLMATAGNAQVSLTWNSSSGATSYNVKRSTTSGGETTIANVGTTNYTDTAVANGSTYYYKVSALNAGGETTNSSEVSATPSGGANYIAGVLALSPTGFWPLNETNGTTAFDISGNNNNGTYRSGVTLGVAGVPNPQFAGFVDGDLAAGFSGLGNTNSYVSLTNCPINSATVTITEWIYPTVSGALGTTFWNAGQNAGFSQDFYNHAALGYNWHGGDGAQWTFSAFTPPVGQWSFVAMVIRPTNAVFYMGNTNGLFSLTNNDGNSAVNFTTGTTIGGPSDGSDTGFNGSLSDVAVFDYSLTTSQITQLYLNANGGSPIITSQSASQTNFCGSTLQLAVSVAGNSPFTYQWMAGPIGSGTYTNVANGGNIYGATNATLIITNATLANAADYIVVVKNSQGMATSANPVTEAMVNLIISGPSPSSSVLYSGGNVNFSANFIGPAPVTYFWETNGVPFNISTSGNSNSVGVTNAISVLNIPNVSSFDANSYCFVATNVYGAVTSAPAILTVLPTSSIMSRYTRAVLSAGPMAYWRFDELSGTNAYDCVGGHDAIYGAETLLGLDGPCSPQWPGFETTNYAFEPLPGFSESTVLVPASDALDLGTNSETLTAWVYFYEEGQSGGILFQRGNGEVVGFGVGTNGDLEYNWNNDPVTTNWDSGLNLPLTQWAFVAWVMTPTNSTFYLYSANGQKSATLNNPHTNVSFSGQIGIGCDPQGGDGEPIFNGILDEVAVFDYPLSAGVINQLFTAASTAPVLPLVLTVSPVGRGQFSLEFSGIDGQSYVVEMSTNLTTGVWTPVYTNVQDGGVFTYTDTNTMDAARFYRVAQ